MADIKIVKLVGGQEVLARFEQGDSHVTIEHPMVFVQTQQGLGLMPFMPFAKDEKFNIRNEQVLCVATPEEEIEQGYRQQTSGIVLANSQDVAGLKLMTE